MSSFYGASGGDGDDSTWGPGACTSLSQLHGMKRLTLGQVIGKKRRKEKIVMCTAYDMFTARVADDALVDIQLVGDSLANVVMGEPRTTAVDLDTMILFAKLVQKGSRRSIVMFDLPYGTYNTPKEAVATTVRVVQETGIQLVKLEGYLPDVVREVQRHAAVCCHIGLLPQTATSFASTGSTAADAERLLQQAVDLQEAGASFLVLEMVCAEAAELISRNLRIPTIGIGAGAGCDGQVLVIHDMLGLCGPGTKVFKFAKRYANLYDMAVSAVGTYRAEVVAGSFPKPCNSTFMKPAESEKLSAICSSGVRAAIDIKALPSEGSTTDISASKTAKTCSAGLESSSDSNEADSREPYKVCVWGGGRMGQLFAWIMAGSISPPVNGDCAEWQRMQMRGTEVTICTSREDLIAACVRKRGMLTALQSAGAASSAVPSDPESGAKHSFMLTNEMVQGGCCASGAGEQRRVNVISRKAAESLGRVFDLVIIACNSGDTQPIAECAFGVARAEGIVASLQNGLKAPRILRALHDRLLLSGGKPSPLVFMPTSLAAAEEEPLHVQKVGNGHVKICGHMHRASQKAEELYAMLRARGVSCELLPWYKLDEILWEKAAVNCCINPLAALLNCANGQLVDPRMELTRKLVVSEVVAVARAKGIPLTFVCII
ncbi:3-methyl-2-oxobutanoate hydroxymethyltransferase, putative [Eimeria tenella]|uniref:3-methyl-2-oxobutanoate hydroxymethyltransferase n=1 Tax=Eimeria tenella TaxID=5802 RepID=U6KZB4_EIMTE|nr:3-methyl-2-oxobutanoate hydroxymethyltransferase, putative [Eimeria tenella]CDJ42273.1 3-methyl-2-oxobutanoate hydroxymethyltransferase, putative [Eimeria tenella]|eukprot:XP_013233023.1 3-methyl-2-oxobutanoate hydroxymethyltransferase, putative [Eimeria tenella]